jgi:hypothetical protein
VFGTSAPRIEILDAHDEASTCGAHLQPRDQGGPHVPEMQATSGARCVTTARGRVRA